MTSLRPRRATIGLIAATLLTTSVVSASHAAPTDPSPAYLVSKATGADSISATDVNWQIDATDLGIFWDNGAGQVLTAFGDTFGEGFTRPFPNGNDWRSNVLLRSTDSNLADGMSFDSAAEDVPGHATRHRRLVLPGRCHARRAVHRRAPPRPATLGRLRGLLLEHAQV